MSSATKVMGGRTARFNRAQLDPLLSPTLQNELPGLATALDEDAMRPLLQATLFGNEARYQIDRCNPGRPLYLAGDSCGLRYELEVRDTASGERIERLVIGRVFRDHMACAAFLRDRLEPAAARLRGRPELAIFRTPIALLEPLSLVVRAFPIDPELPTLSDATDRRRLVELLGTLLSEQEEHFTIRDCRVDVADYGRWPRCTLRYSLEGAAANGAPRRREIYGKVTADASGEQTLSVTTALRERLTQPGDPNRIAIPNVLAFKPDLQLLLLEAIPGQPFIRRLLKEHLAGTETPLPSMPSLEEAMAGCGRIAAAIHTTKIGLGAQRTFDDELRWSHRCIQALRRVSPDLGAQLQAWHAQIAAYARQDRPLELGFSHGDFTETNVISDGTSSGVVDFDTVCQAEPALDLGQFLARQRLAILNYQRSDAPLPAVEAERLCVRFLDAYVDAAGSNAAEAQRLRARTRLYEVLMLLRLAVHSWQKIKVGRLAHAVTLLEERVACLAEGERHAGERSSGFWA